ncbi:MAG: choice-of-anchor D domain-containing protein, partial [Terriglobia bacterium]
MQEKVRGKGQFASCVWLGLAFLMALVFLTPLGVSVKLSSAAPGPDFKAASRARLGSPTTILRPEAGKKIVESYLRLPLIFEANQGQTNARVKYISRGDGYALFLTDHDAVLELRQASEQPSKRPTARDSRNSKPAAVKVDVLQLELAGSSPSAQAAGLDELPGKSNYYIGNDPADWHTNIPQYSKVEYHAIYPGVNLVYYGSQGRLEYDFDLAPGVNPAIITLSIDGLGGLGRAADRNDHAGLQVDSQGSLVMSTPAGTMSFAKPVVYQVSHDPSGAIRKTFVNARYVVKDASERGKALVGFEVASYDKNLPLVIDPTLTYSTYIGGSLLDQGQSVALDSNGNAYVTGTTMSTNFPNVPGTIQPSGCGGTCLGNVFVMELTPSTSTLVYSTYLGGNGDDTGFGLAVDGSGDAFVTGEATSTTFPTTPGAYQPNCGGPTGACQDAFVSEIGPGGTALRYSTYFGGNGNDLAYAIVLDSAGDAYIGGLTVSTNLFTTPGAYQTKCGTDGNCNGGASDGFLTEFNVTKIPAVVYSTYLGGSGADWVKALVLDSAGDVYLTGETKSKDFPTTTGAYQSQCILDTTKACEGDAFATKLNPALTGTAELLASTRLGSSAQESGNGIAVDSSSNVYLAGSTASTSFPVMNAYQPTFGGGPQDGFVAEFKPDLTALIFSTFLGGNNFDVVNSLVLGPDNTIYVAGSSNSTNFPTTSNALYTSLNQGSNSSNCGSNDTTTCDDAIVTEFDNSGGVLLFSTYLGGTEEDDGNGLALDSTGNAYGTGYTNSSNFPTQNPTTAACAGTCGTGANDDAFLSEIGGITIPYALFSPTSLSFPNQNMGSTSPPQPITVTNSGSAKLTVSSIVIGGANPTDFKETDNCIGSPVNPGSNCTINVTFTPPVQGSASATLTVTDTSSNSPEVIQLSGTGVLLSISISPTSLNFSGQAPNTTSPPQAVTVKNTGSGTITLSNIVITGPYAFATGSTCTSSTQLTANQTCVMNVTFKPTGLGAENGSITLTDNAPGSPQSVPLTGNGSAAGVLFSPTSLSFGNVPAGQKSTPKTITITNNGNINLTVTKVTAVGTNASDFSASPNGCNSVAPNKNCSITVTFTPAAPGPRSASVSVTDNAPASPQSVPVMGTGTGPGASLSPPAGLSFGGQAVNSASNPQMVTLTNTGTSALTITGISVTGANASDFSQTNTCGTSLAANANCTISVTFKPTAAGNLAAALSVADNAAGSPQTVPLTGAGADFTITATTTSQSVTPGQTATYNTLSLTPQGGFSQQVTLTCSGQPAASTCTVQPPTVTPNGSATPLTVTVVTTAASLAPPFSHVLPPPTSSGIRWVWIFSILGMLTLTTLFAQRKTRRAAWILAPVMLWILMASACGSNSSSGGGGGGTGGTPPGTYT